MRYCPYVGVTLIRRLVTINGTCIGYINSVWYSYTDFVEYGSMLVRIH